MTSGRAHGLGNHLNGHSDLVFPEPLEDLPEVTRPPFLQSVNSFRGLTQSSQWGRGRRAEVLSPSPSPSSRNCPSDPTGKVPKLSSSLGNLQPGRVPGAVPGLGGSCCVLQIPPSLPALGQQHWPECH